MSAIIGANNDPLASFTLLPGQSTRVWWYGFGPEGIGYNVGFAFPPSIRTISNRIVTVNHGMEFQEWAGDSNILYTADFSAEDVQGSGGVAVFRVEIGELG